MIFFFVNNFFNKRFDGNHQVIALQKIPPFLQIFWREKFVETHNSECVICAKLCGNCVFSHNFRSRKFGKSTVFYTVSSG